MATDGFGGIGLQAERKVAKFCQRFGVPFAARVFNGDSAMLPRQISQFGMAARVSRVKPNSPARVFGGQEGASTDDPSIEQSSRALRMPADV